MKNLLMLCAFLFLFSCSQPKEGLDQLVGTWELNSSSGGLSGGGDTNPNFDELQVNADYSFTLFNEGFNVAEGIVESTDTFPGFSLVVNFNFTDFEIINQPGLVYDPEKAVDREEKSLNLISNCCDRFNYHFVKD